MGGSPPSNASLVPGRSPDGSVQWVGRSAAGVPGGGGGGSVGTPAYIPQNDTLIILNISKKIQEKIALQLRIPSAKVRPGGQVGVKSFFVFFIHF